MAAARAEMEIVLQDVGAGRADATTWNRLCALRYGQREVAAILGAASRHRTRDLSLGGEMVGPITLGEPWRGTLLVEDTIEGSLNVQIGASGELVLAGATIAGDVTLTDDATIDSLSLSAGTVVAGDVVIDASLVDGEVRVDDARIGGDLRLRDATIAGRIWLSGTAFVGGSLRVEHTRVGADVWIVGRAEVGGNIVVMGDSEVEGGLLVDWDARVVGAVYLGDRVRFSGGVDLSGSVDALEVHSHVEGELELNGAAASVTLAGRLGGPVRLVPSRGPVVDLRSVAGARFEQVVHVGDRVSIIGCDLRRCGDLDRLDLVGVHLLVGHDRRRSRRLANPPVGVEARIPDGEMASIYRQLRVNLEGKGNRPASAFFYRGEMDSRGRAARQRGGVSGRAEWAWIGLYRIVAGYGLRVARPLLWFGVLVGLGGVALHSLDTGRDWPATFVYTAQAMLSLFRPPDPSDDWRVGLLQIVLRLVGPILLGLAAFAVRDKVAR